jgi:kinetochore protein NDC80
MHVQKNLEDYESFVVDEQEKELDGDVDARDDTQAMYM